MAEKKFDLKTWWDGQSPKRRQQMSLAGVLVGVTLLSLILLQGGAVGARTPDLAKEDSKIANSLLPDANTRDIGLTGLVKDVEGNRNDTQRIEERLARLEELGKEQSKIAQEGGGRSRDQQVREELDAIRKQLDEFQKNGVPAAGTVNPDAEVAPVDEGTGEAPNVGYGGIRSITEVAPPAPKANAAKAAPPAPQAPPPRMYLPSGSIISGVMLTGLDAPTGKGALKDPVPVLVRIQKEAILPNLYRADIKECFALVAGQGDLASERAYLRSESISCVRKDKTVIDLNMKAYVVDTDGKAGLRGRLVSKQGSVLGKAIIASFADGVAQAFKGDGGGGNMTDGAVNVGAATQSGAVMGVSSSLDRISKYYLDLADQLFPILEIDAGRSVTLVLVKGLEMTTVR